MSIYSLSSPATPIFIGNSFWSQCGSHFLKDDEQIIPINTRQKCGAWVREHNLTALDFNDPTKPIGVGEFWEVAGDLVQT